MQVDKSAFFRLPAPLPDYIFIDTTFICTLFAFFSAYSENSLRYRIVHSWIFFR